MSEKNGVTARDPFLVCIRCGEPTRGVWCWWCLRIVAGLPPWGKR